MGTSASHGGKPPAPPVPTAGPGGTGAATVGPGGRGATAPHSDQPPALPVGEAFKRARAARRAGGGQRTSPPSMLRRPPWGTPSRVRSDGGTLAGVHCVQRDIPGDNSKLKHSVKLVVFDLDETLTLTTFLPEDGTFTPDQYEFVTKLNFESPWVEGRRLNLLKGMLEDLVRGKNGQTRTLAILTKNQSTGGASAVIDLLKISGLSAYFSVVWNMHSRSGGYREGDEWKVFNPPFHDVADHKAHVLLSIAQNVHEWIPSVGQNDGPALPHLLAQEEIVLVDDQTANFQSNLGVKVSRCCKVAHYDAEYYDFGLIRGMGGIGARDLRDFSTLVRFVEDPQDFEESMQCSCVQLDGVGVRPVKLVVFDFDETLTLATFMPEDPAFRTQVGWRPQGSERSDWTVAHLAKYNFESPWVPGSRIEQLKSMLNILAQDENGHRRTLAVLARNPSGPVAVLNLLLMAGLAEYFSAVWGWSPKSNCPQGVHLQGGQWHCFNLPLLGSCRGDPAVADVLHSIVEHTSDWFPQLHSGDASVNENLSKLLPEEITLVDDERANFWSNDVSRAEVMRYCKVMRYDEEYRDCGYLQSMGGIGARCASDYKAILDFVRCPSAFPYRGSRPQTLTAKQWLSVTRAQKSRCTGSKSCSWRAPSPAMRSTSSTGSSTSSS